MNTYEAWVAVNGTTIPVTLQANTSWEAKQLFEAQYGANNVKTLPHQK